jgi:hypothetical protein
MTFEEAIMMGEYDPKYLDRFEEWVSLTSYQKLQYTKQAMDIRRQNLTLQLAEMYNVLNFSEKPELQATIDKLHLELKQIEIDREKLYTKYASEL